jgi:uncharacterized membrane protein YhaH (DUF805 family)
MTYSYGEALLDPVNRTFDFSGRSSRKQFWPFIALYIAAASMIPMFGTALPQSGQFGDPIAFDMNAALAEFMWKQGMLFALFVIPLMSATTRRLHDAGWSGLWAVPLPILHLVVFLLQAKVMADSVQNQAPELSPYYGICFTIAMVYNVVTLGIAILCVLPSDDYANSFGDPQTG